MYSKLYDTTTCIKPLSAKGIKQVIMVIVIMYKGDKATLLVYNEKRPMVELLLPG